MFGIQAPKENTKPIRTLTKFTNSPTYKITSHSGTIALVRGLDFEQSTLKPAEELLFGKTRK